VQRVPLPLHLVSARRDVVSLIRESINRVLLVTEVAVRPGLVSSIRGSISRAPRAMSAVARQVWAGWIRESINRGPRETVGRADVDVKVVKKGNQAEVTCTEALALSVEPAPKPAEAREK